MAVAFPADHELVAFFEVEPRVVDAGVPWIYNTLDFETERRGVLVRCRIRPSYGDISVRLVMGGSETTRIEIRDFRNVDLVANAQGEALVGTSEHGRDMLCLMLKPRVWVGLGDFKEIPPHAMGALSAAPWPRPPTRLAWTASRCSIGMPA
ncbi:MAG TPA: hypothetical protein VG758_04370 [Hyphomicrobiaceae bacterium]|jgi:hypothetical protein|nr:hypothetical protein [Hyphomicrobiaceae bacterium]